MKTQTSKLSILSLGLEFHESQRRQTDQESPYITLMAAKLPAMRNVKEIASGSYSESILIMQVPKPATAHNPLGILQPPGLDCEAVYSPIGTLMHCYFDL